MGLAGGLAGAVWVLRAGHGEMGAGGVAEGRRLGRPIPECLLWKQVAGHWSAPAPADQPIISSAQKNPCFGPDPETTWALRDCLRCAISPSCLAPWSRRSRAVQNDSQAKDYLLSASLDPLFR